MPYKSEAQRRYFNSEKGKKEIGKEEVEHWNEVSKGKKLPEKTLDKAIRLCDSIVKFPSEKEAIEYCKENGINPSNIRVGFGGYVVDDPNYRPGRTYKVSFIVVDKNDNGTREEIKVFANSKEEAMKSAKLSYKGTGKFIRDIKVE